MYTEFMIVPGIYPDFGCGVGTIRSWMSARTARKQPSESKTVVPEVQAGAKLIGELAKLPPPDPEKDVLMSRILEEYRYFWENSDKKYIEQYGYLDGFSFTMGPVETAAIVMGYENFLIDMHDYPKLIHRILTMTTDFTIGWLKAQVQFLHIEIGE